MLYALLGSLMKMRRFHCYHLMFWLAWMPALELGYRLDCGGLPKQTDDSHGVCAHFQGNHLDSLQSPQYHLVDDSKIVFNFR